MPVSSSALVQAQREIQKQAAPGQTITLHSNAEGQIIVEKFNAGGFGGASYVEAKDLTEAKNVGGILARGGTREEIQNAATGNQFSSLYTPIPKAPQVSASKPSPPGYNLRYPPSPFQQAEQAAAKAGTANYAYQVGIGPLNIAGYENRQSIIYQPQSKSEPFGIGLSEMMSRDIEASRQRGDIASSWVPSPFKEMGIIGREQFYGMAQLTAKALDVPFEIAKPAYKSLMGQKFDYGNTGRNRVIREFAPDAPLIAASYLGFRGIAGATSKFIPKSFLVEGTGYQTEVPRGLKYEKGVGVEIKSVQGRPAFSAFYRQPEPKILYETIFSREPLKIATSDIMGAKFERTASGKTITPFGSVRGSLRESGGALFESKQVEPIFPNKISSELSKGAAKSTSEGIPYGLNLEKVYFNQPKASKAIVPFGSTKSLPASIKDYSITLAPNEATLSGGGISPLFKGRLAKSYSESVSLRFTDDLPKIRPGGFGFPKGGRGGFSQAKLEAIKLTERRNPQLGPFIPRLREFFGGKPRILDVRLKPPSGGGFKAESPKFDFVQVRGKGGTIQLQKIFQKQGTRGGTISKETQKLIDKTLLNISEKQKQSTKTITVPKSFADLVRQKRVQTFRAFTPTTTLIEKARQRQRSATLQIFKQRQSQPSKISNPSSFKTIYKELQRQRAGTLTSFAPIEKVRTSERAITKQFTPFETMQKEAQTERVFTITIPIPKNPTEEIISSPFPNDEKKKRGPLFPGLNLFKLSVRRRGKFTPKGVFPRALAIQKGKEFAERTLGATFALKPAGGNIAPPNPAQDFASAGNNYYRKISQTFGELFIQRRGQRLASFGERIEIKVTKRLKSKLGGLRFF